MARRSKKCLTWLESNRPWMLALLFFQTFGFAVFGQAPDRSATLSNFTAISQVPLSEYVSTILFLDPYDKSVQAAPKDLAGFFFTSAQTQEVVQVATWLDQSISAEQFPDPLLESLKALALVVLNGSLSGKKVAATLSTTPNGRKASLSIDWGAATQITPEAAFANAADRFNQLVRRAITSKPETLEDGNIVAIHGWLKLLSRGLRVQGTPK